MMKIGAVVYLVVFCAGYSLAQDVALIHGVVLREDLKPFQNPIDLSVIASRAEDPNPIRAVINGSTYEVRIPAYRATERSIWTIEFSEGT